MSGGKSSPDQGVFEHQDQVWRGPNGLRFFLKGVASFLIIAGVWLNNVASGGQNMGQGSIGGDVFSYKYL